MKRAWLIGLVVAWSLSLGLAATTAATDPGPSVSSGEPGLAAPRPGGAGELADPRYAFYVGDWHLNPATGHYYSELENMSWAEAEAHAVRLGGHLVTINDQAEQDWLFSTFGQQSQVIGFNDLTSPGTWVWSSDEPVTYTNWVAGFPEILVRGIEDVVRFPVSWGTAPVVHGAGRRWSCRRDHRGPERAHDRLDLRHGHRG